MKYLLSTFITVLSIPAFIYYGILSLFLLFDKTHFKNYWIGLDQMYNAIYFGNPDETISSRVGKIVRSWKRKKRWTVAYMLYALLNWIDPQHCEDSIEEDEV